ncbi:hypothetical protein LCGC14_1762150 [marine sediment metagenome]|uniref:Portal protein n=1 Tax=marine sediment metagenome TaxID=412755 RepID=A0A0F9H0N5_9ZZZZ
MPDTKEDMTPAVPAQYVNSLLEELKNETRGLHIKMNEIELLRHYEDPIQLPTGETPSGLEVRIGATAELIENIKASLTANKPNVVITALRTGDPATENSSKREAFWGQFLKWINKPVPVLAELVDAQAGLGIGIKKAAFYPWPKKERKRLKGESDKDFRDRLRALKKKWGPPFRVITIHPLTFYFRLGPGNEITESIEHSWKSKRDVYPAYGFDTDAELNAFDQTLNPEIAEAVAATPGQPDQEIRPFPSGLASESMVLVTEYRRERMPNSQGVYQVYINGRLVYQEVGDPSCKYFFCLGRITSSKDPDKLGISVAESFRHNEPLINRALTRMGEAVEMLVRKRLTIEVPDDFHPEMVEIAGLVGESNNLVPRQYKFQYDKADTLPAGAKVIDPFKDVGEVFGAMPFINLLMSIMGQHGVSPIFKGEPPGAGGSGYRDNSLYMMAKSQFEYLIESYSGCLVSLIEWLEGQLVSRVRQEIWVGDLPLKPKDVQEWPATIEVNIDPLLPQNLIAEGQFYDRMHTQGHITRRTMQEKGLRIDQPEMETRGRWLEDLQEMMKPILYQDVLQTVGVLPPPQPQLVGPDGQPIQSQNGGGGGGMIGGASNGAQANIAQMLQEMGGRTRQGQPRQPPEESGSTPGREGF